MKGKKILLSVLSSICFVFLFFSLAACGNSSTEQHHVHEWNDGDIVNPATCTEAGLIAFTCKTCEETK